MNGLQGTALWQAYVHTACKVAFALIVVYVLVTAMRRLREYDKALEQYFADTEHMTMRSVRNVLVLVVVISCVSLVFNVVGRHSFADFYCGSGHSLTAFHRPAVCVRLCGASPHVFYR